MVYVVCSTKKSTDEMGYWTEFGSMNDAVQNLNALNEEAMIEKAPEWIGRWGIVTILDENIEDERPIWYERNVLHNERAALLRRVE